MLLFFLTLIILNYSLNRAYIDAIKMERKGRNKCKTNGVKKREKI